MVFDSTCRVLLFDICKKHGLHLEGQPEYGGRKYLEKQDYILAKRQAQMEQQNRTIEAQKEKLDELTMRLEDVEMLIDEVSEIAYDKAVEVVTETVRAETQQEDIALIQSVQQNLNASNRNSPEALRIANRVLDIVRDKLLEATGQILKKVQRAMHDPVVRSEKKRGSQDKGKKLRTGKITSEGN